MFRREQLEKCNKLIIVGLIIIPQWLLIILYIEIRKFNFSFDICDKRLGNLFVEKVGFGVCQSPTFKVVELFYKLFVLCKKSVKNSCVKNEPFIDVGNYQMFGFKIVLRDSFSEVVEHQFVKSFCIQPGSRNHLLVLRFVFIGARECLRHFAFVGRFLCFYDYSDRAFCLVSVVDYKVVSSFCVYVMIWVVIGLFKKVNDEIFMKLFRFGIICSVE